MTTVDRYGRVRGTGTGVGWTAEELAALRRFRAEGWTPSRIAQWLGCTPQRVRDRIRRDEEKPSPGKPRKAPPGKAERKCLCCGHRFLSDWIGNRMCGACKSRGYSMEGWA